MQQVADVAFESESALRSPMLHLESSTFLHEWGVKMQESFVAKGLKVHYRSWPLGRQSRSYIVTFMFWKSYRMFFFFQMVAACCNDFGFWCWVVMQSVVWKACHSGCTKPFLLETISDAVLIIHHYVRIQPFDLLILCSEAKLGVNRIKELGVPWCSHCPSPFWLIGSIFKIFDPAACHCSAPYSQSGLLA